jgi:hypothetical protein
VEDGGVVGHEVAEGLCVVFWSDFFGKGGVIVVRDESGGVEAGWGDGTKPEDLGGCYPHGDDFLEFRECWKGDFGE